MFTYPAKELFNAEGTRRVVWSEEEYSAALAEGWSEEKPEPKPAEEQPAAKPAKAPKA